VGERMLSLWKEVLDLVSIHLRTDRELREHMKNALSVMEAFHLFEIHPQLLEMTATRMRKLGLEALLMDHVQEASLTESEDSDEDSS
jgi:hypothetical protein